MKTTNLDAKKIFPSFEVSQQWKIFFGLGIILIGIISGLFLYGWIQPGSVDLVLDMEISHGGWIVVDVNNNYDQVSALPIAPGVRTLYQFKEVPSLIRQLRIDLTDNVGANVKIFQIAFWREGKELLQLNAETVKNWGIMNAQPLNSTHDYYYFKNLTADTIITQKMAYCFDRGLKRIFHLAGMTRIFKDVFSFFDIFILLPLMMVLILAMVDFRGSVSLLGGVVSMLFMILSVGIEVASFFLKRSGMPPPINRAVGYASYVGYSKAVEMQAFLALVFIALFCGMIFFLFLRKRHRDCDQFFIDSQVENPTSIPFLFAILGILSILIFPPLDSAYAVLDTIKHADGWDSMNMLVWRYEMIMGWLPYKDFWYPYGGGLAYFWGPSPWSMFYLFLLKWLIFGTFALAIYWLTNKSKAWTLFITGVIGCLIQSNYILCANRYFISLDYILCFLVLLGSSQQRRRDYVLFGAFLGLFFLCDPVYLFYAGLSLVVLLGVQLVEVKGVQRLELIKNLMACAGAFALFVAGDIISLWKNGQLEGFLYFFKYLSAHSVSSALPTPLNQWLRFGLTPNHFLTQLIPLFVGYGFF